MVRILVIDDDRHIRRACERVLTKAEASVVCAETGEEGLKALTEASEKIDVILLDRIMPGEINAVEMVAKIHSLDATIPVVLMSGSAAQTIQVEAAQAGAVGCLSKPFTPDQLRHAIKAALKTDSLI
jgi:DNA-binding NtrC family response regulator